MYTSGSTGKPKGVVLTHRNLLSTLSAIIIMVLSYKIDSDMYLSYLPTSHILEYIIQLAALTGGVPIGFGTPHSLTDAMVRGCRGDLAELRPTLLAGVPQVWDTIRREIMYQVRRRGRRVEKVFGAFVSLKWYLMQNSLPHSWLDWLVFNKVKRVLGGRLR
ncbi:long-chain fatty acid-CoA ligase, partial [Linderina pennispora]